MAEGNRTMVPNQRAELGTHDAVITGKADRTTSRVGPVLAFPMFQNSLWIVGFEVLTAVSTKMAVFWVVAPCSLVEYTALQPRRQSS
jgi:hypothetical protein